MTRSNVMIGVPSGDDVSRVQKRLSGLLLDRIDLHVEAPRVEYDRLVGDGPAEPSAAVRARVEAARERQRARFAGTNR